MSRRAGPVAIFLRSRRLATDTSSTSTTRTSAKLSPRSLPTSSTTHFRLSIFGVEKLRKLCRREPLSRSVSAWRRVLLRWRRPWDSTSSPCMRSATAEHLGQLLPKPRPQLLGAGVGDVPRQVRLTALSGHGGERLGGGEGDALPGVRGHEAGAGQPPLPEAGDEIEPVGVRLAAVDPEPPAPPCP